MKRSGGFSLTELLITFVIVAIIAAIAIPNLLEAKRISSEKETARLLSDMGTGKVACAQVTRNGYNITPVAESNQAVQCAAVAVPVEPEGWERTGDHGFRLDSRGKVWKSLAKGGTVPNESGLDQAYDVTAQ